MNKLRLSIVLMALALILAIVPAVFAQDQTLGLSQSDFDFWTTANENSTSVDQVAFDFTLGLAVTGLEDSNISADLSGTGMVGGSEASPLFQLSVAGNVSDGDQTTPVNIEVRFVDNFIYYNLGDGEGWKGQAQGDALDSLGGMFSQGMMSGMGMEMDPSSITGGDLSSLDSAGDMMSMFNDINPSDFISVTRTDADGTADYAINVDLNKLMSSPAFMQLLTEGMSSGAGTEEAGADSSFGGMNPAMMIVGVLSLAEINAHQYIDTSTQLVDRATLDFSLPFTEDSGVSFNFGIDLHDYNTPFTVEVPADVEMLPAETGATAG